jgi:hypothetical protein
VRTSRWARSIGTGQFVQKPMRWSAEALLVLLWSSTHDCEFWRRWCQQMYVKLEIWLRKICGGYLGKHFRDNHGIRIQQYFKLEICQTHTARCELCFHSILQIMGENLIEHWKDLQSWMSKSKKVVVRSSGENKRFSNIQRV